MHSAKETGVRAFGSPVSVATTVSQAIMRATVPSLTWILKVAIVYACFAITGPPRALKLIKTHYESYIRKSSARKLLEVLCLKIGTDDPSITSRFGRRNAWNSGRRADCLAFLYGK